jgi:UDP-N-acetylmuramoyl-tripeptide--D-alanyl-D-alanine ligase
MRELGDNQAVSYHQSVGRYAKNRANLVIGIGELAQQYQPQHWFANADEAAELIFSFLKEGDSILVKGSKATQMYKIIQIIEQKSVAKEEDHEFA